MIFWRDWRLVARKERPGDGLGRGWEIILAFSIVGFYVGYSGLSGIRAHDSFTSASTFDFLLIGTPAFYGIRIAQFIARARQYRLPQTLEWLVFVVPLLGFLVCAVGSSRFVKSYGIDHGYLFCGARSDHPEAYVFARPPERCPLIPQGQSWKR
jgi:hypothetical protein